MMTGEFLLFGGLFSLISQVLVFVLVLLVAVAVATGRGEPDPGRARLRATYLCTVAFFSLFAVLFSAGAAMGSLMEMVGDDDDGESSAEVRLSPHFDDDDDFDPGEHFIDVDDDGGDEGDLSDVVQGVLFAVVAGGVLLYHRDKLQEMQGEPGFRDGPAAVVLHGYFYASSAVALIAFVVAASTALHALAQVVAPGSLSIDDADTVREDGARRLFTGAFVALASLAVVALHQREREALDAPEAGPSGDPIEGDYPIA